MNNVINKNTYDNISSYSKQSSEINYDHRNELIQSYYFQNNLKITGKVLYIIISILQRIS